MLYIAFSLSVNVAVIYTIHSQLVPMPFCPALSLPQKAPACTDVSPEIHETKTDFGLNHLG